MDALGEILGSFGVSGSLFSQARFGTPWSVHSDPVPSAMFHVVVAGGAYLRLDGEREAHALATGDIALMPHGAGHVMAGDPKTRPIPIASVATYDEDASVARIDYPGQGGGDGRATCSILCGTIRFDDELGHPLVAHLPRLIHRRNAAVAGWIDATIRMLSAEVDHQMPGTTVMVSKLAEMLFVQVLRGYIADLDESAAPVGWIAGLKDTRVGRALALIHRKPGERWTGGSLATRVGMSRSTLFARFTDLVGQPPTQYLTSWRMHVAKLALTNDDLGLAELADRVGYTSEGAFSKAFKRTVGINPSEFRMSNRPAVV